MNRVAIEGGAVTAGAISRSHRRRNTAAGRSINARNDGMKPDLRPFQTLIKERCGLLFEGSSEEKLAHTLAERSAALALPLAAYYVS